MATPPRLMLLDSASMYFRAFHGVPESVTAPDGTPDRCGAGVSRRRQPHAHRPSGHRPGGLLRRRLAAAVARRPRPRVQGAPRRTLTQDPDAEEVPDALAPQVPVIEAVLDAIGIARVGVERTSRRTT